MSPEYISTSPASTTSRSISPSVRRARLGREPSCGEVVPHPDRLGPKRAPGRAEVPPSKGAPRMTTCRVGVRRGVVEVAHRDAEEGEVGAELLAVAGHARSLAPAPRMSSVRGARAAEPGADGAEGPQGVDQVSWGSAASGHDESFTPTVRVVAVDVDHLAVDAEAHQRVAVGPGTNQNWLRYQPPGSTGSLSVLGERLRVRRRGVPRVGQPRRRDHLCRRRPSSSSSCRTGPGPARWRTSLRRGWRMPTGSQVMSASCSAPIGDPEQARDQVGHPSPARPLEHPAEHVGVGRAVGEVAAVRRRRCRGWRGSRTCRGGRPRAGGASPSSAPSPGPRRRARRRSPGTATPVRMSSR